MRSSFGTVSAWGVTITALAPRFSAICASSVAARVPLWLAPTITGIAPAAATPVRVSSARPLSSQRWGPPPPPAGEGDAPPAEPSHEAPQPVEGFEVQVFIVVEGRRKDRVHAFEG